MEPLPPQPMNGGPPKKLPPKPQMGPIKKGPPPQPLPNDQRKPLPPTNGPIPPPSLYQGNPNNLPPPPPLSNLPPPPTNLPPPPTNLPPINSLPPPPTNLPPINSLPPPIIPTSSPPPIRANPPPQQPPQPQQPQLPNPPNLLDSIGRGNPQPPTPPMGRVGPPPPVNHLPPQQPPPQPQQPPPNQQPPLPNQPPKQQPPVPNYNNRPLSPPPPLQTPSIPPTNKPPVPNYNNRPLSPPPPLQTPTSPPPLPTHGSNPSLLNNPFRNSTDNLSTLASQSLDQPDIYPQTRVAEENFNYLKDIFNKINKRSQASSSCSREGNSLAEAFKNYGTMLISQSDNQLGQCLFKIGDFQREYETFRDLLDIQSLSGLKVTVDQFINKDMKVVRASRKNFDKIKGMYEQIDTKVSHNASKGKGINLVKQAELQQERDYLKGKVVQVGQESLQTIKLANESNSVEIMEQMVEYMENMQNNIRMFNEQMEQLQPTIAAYKKESIRRRQELDKVIESQKQSQLSSSNGFSTSSMSNSMSGSGVDRSNKSDELYREVPGEEPKKTRLRRFISGERNYVSSINTLVSVYLAGLRTDDRLFSKIFKEDEVAIFSNIELLYSNQTKFLEELENCLKNWGEQTTPSIGAIFFRNAPKLMQLYSTYVNNFSKALVTISRCKQSKNFQAFLKTCEDRSDGTDLDSLIPLPLTRVTNYLIFLQDYKDTLSGTSNPSDQTELKHVLGAKDKIQSISELVEQSHNLIQLSKIQQSLIGFDSTLVEEGRFLIKEASLGMSLNSSHHSGSANQLSQYYFILLTDILIYCKKQNVLFPVILSDWAGEGAKNNISNQKYKFIGKFDLKNMDVKNNQDSSEDSKTGSNFQLVGGGVVATLHFETKSIKEEWMQTIKKTIHKCNQNKLFGIPLETLYSRPVELGRAIPTFVQRIIDYLYDNGTQEEGIFRLSANQKSLDLAREEIETGVELDYSEMDIHAVAGLLKLWVRNLPEPLLTFKYFDQFIQIAEIDSKPQRYQAIKNIVDRLPNENRFCIYYLMRLLTKVSESSATNKMTPNNISIVFATLLLRKKDANPMDCTNFNTIFGVIEGFMTGFKEIFTDTEKLYQDYLVEQNNSQKRKSVIPNKPLPTRPPDSPGLSQRQLPTPGSSNGSPQSSSGSSSLAGSGNNEIEWTKQTFDDGSDSEDEGFSIGSKQASITIQLGEIVRQGYLTKKGAMRRNWTKRWFVLKQGYLFYFKTSKDKKPKGIIQLINVHVARSYYKPNCMAIRSSIDTNEREFLIVANSQSDLEEWINQINKCCS
ncbi:RhoGEF domain-containing protein [Tieghemostelium lacteum]|uniref:RhoGEF domain-containing protein n=1 Tax=Tieghemostelium lacteum TaxID=361077 RepID=A0A152A3V5_TIELA|nr:RhoGEF domain-containing protein [Tieghemostelium lacteum]|eukprot:KYR00900.1 RhoGEF domain-containing protein [Tieghemostelium lacteum]